jgi:hypothetical protein
MLRNSLLRVPAIPLALAPVLPLTAQSLMRPRLSPPITVSGVGGAGGFACLSAIHARISKTLAAFPSR